MSASAAAIEKARLLLVEGIDEENFFQAALDARDGSAIQVMPIGGKTKLRENLKTLRADPKFGTVRALAIIRDADDNPSAASDAVHGAVQNAGLVSPNGHGCFSSAEPTVGVFIMPDGAAPGMLETLCLASAEAAPGFACVGRYFDCLEGVGIVPGNLHKARAHAWLASRTAPDRRVGEAALVGYWDFTHATFAPLWTFLDRLGAAG